MDEFPIFRKGLVQLLNSEPGMMVCGHTGSVTTATQLLETRHPNVVLMDLRLGTTDVFELIKGWKSRFPSLRMLVLSAYHEPLYVERALRAGAAGYAMKDETCDETINAIRTVLAGQMYVSRKMATGLLHKLIQRKPAARDTSVELLSARERQVFRILGAGLNSRRIGNHLHLSIKTIETYRENIKFKLGLRNAAELVRHATQWVQSHAHIPAQSHEANNRANNPTDQQPAHVVEDRNGEETPDHRGEQIVCDDSKDD